MIYLLGSMVLFCMMMVMLSSMSMVMPLLLFMWFDLWLSYNYKSIFNQLSYLFSLEISDFRTFFFGSRWRFIFIVFSFFLVILWLVFSTIIVVSSLVVIIFISISWWPWASWSSSTSLFLFSFRLLTSFFLFYSIFLILNWSIIGWCFLSFHWSRLFNFNFLWLFLDFLWFRSFYFWSRFSFFRCILNFWLFLWLLFNINVIISILGISFRSPLSEFSIRSNIGKCLW